MFEYDAPSGLLESKVILITGAGDGMGRALAKSCANLGATIILLGRTLSKLSPSMMTSNSQEVKRQFWCRSTLSPVRPKTMKISPPLGMSSAIWTVWYIMRVC